MTLAVTLAIALLAGGCTAAAHIPPPAAATAAFGRLLHQRYGDIHGFWTCPAGQTLGKSRIGCLAEVQAGETWHMTSATASVRDGHVAFSQITDNAWIRHWWPYSRQFILRSREPQVPGVISVNSPAYDWGFLLTACDSSRPTRRCDAYDGDGNGLFQFFLFTCSGSRDLVTCTNKLGDSVRYRPHPG